MVLKFIIQNGLMFFIYGLVLILSTAMTSVALHLELAKKSKDRTLVIGSYIIGAGLLYGGLYLIVKFGV